MNRILYIIFLIPLFSFSQTRKNEKSNRKNILPGAFQTNLYFNLLKGKHVAVFANHTSAIHTTHIIDSFIKAGINVRKIFAPEHGFRGKADAGEKLENSIDSSTKIPVISLYGKRLKPSAFELSDIDIMLFDVQDVGVRFYTYISSLQYFIEAAIENNKPLIILDRPNPNGFYIDGPVLEPEYKSFVGMQTIPIVYGMTIGEYAKMMIGEKWLDWRYVRETDNRISLGELMGFETTRKNFSLTVIPCKNYTHKSKYSLPVKPSPNLATMQSVYWYPSICLFEGTTISEGRGTAYPFCIFGHPSFNKDLYKFIPQSTAGAKEPKFMNKNCYGFNVFKSNTDSVLNDLNSQLNLQYLINCYKMFPNNDSFFIKPKSENTVDYFFNKLAGNNTLMEQLKQGKTDKEIRASWQPGLEAFKKIRKKYLLYEDF